MNKKLLISLIAGIGLFFDQIIKLLVITKMSFYESIEIIKNFFSITLAKNTGGAFSIFSNSTCFLVLVTIVFAFVLIKFINKEEKLTTFKSLTYAFIIAGMLGNFFDRVVRGYVIDYLHFNIFGYDFPIFNLADILIVVGVGLMILEMIGSEYNEYISRRRKN